MGGALFMPEGLEIWRNLRYIYVDILWTSRRLFAAFSERMIPVASSTQKKTGSTRASASDARASSGRGSSAGRSSGSTSRKRAPEPARRPIRREVGALVCLLLGVFSALGYFQVEAIFIDFLCGTVKGLIGYGYWLLPPALLWCAAILGFHRGRPVQLRVWCTVLTPVILGSLLHLFLFKSEFAWSGEIVKILWTQGKTMTSGGVLAGLFSQALIAVFSKIGAGMVLILALCGLLMGSFRYLFFRDL